MHRAVKAWRVAHRRGHGATVAHDSRREKVARVLTAVYALALGLTILAWFADRDLSRRFLALVFGTLNIPASASLVSVVVLGLIVGALMRRKRIALVLVGVFQVLGAIWSIVLLWRVLESPDGPPRGGLVALLGVNGLVALETVADLVALGSLVLVWWLRPAFPARTLRGSWWRSLAALALGTGLSLLVARLLLPLELATDRGPTTWRMLRAALRRSLGMEFPRDMRLLAQIDRPVALLLEVLLSLTLIAAIYLFLRSGRASPWRSEDEVRLRDLLARYGDADSLGYFATRRDRSCVFSGDGRALISSRVVGSVCLMAGDPVGAPDAWPDALDRWLATARRYGWVPAATSVGEDGARLLAGRGFGVLALGDEAVLEPDRFRLDSTSMTSVRHAVARARRAGLTVRIRRHGELTAGELAELTRRADAWRVGGPERGFSMALERLGDAADGRCVLVSAHGPDGVPVAFLSFVPWGRSGLSLDLMRRAPDAPNGVNELLVADLMAAAGGWGIRRVSLNFAVARAAFAESERLGAGPITRAGGNLLGVLDRFTQIESLYRNNERYRPAWRPRYVCVSGTLFLPAVAFAIARAEGFVPPLRRRRRPERGLTSEQLILVAAAEVRARQAPPPGPRRSDQTRHRLRHLQELRAAGRDPYAVGRHSGDRLRDLDADTWRGAAAQGRELRVSARVRGLRRHGGVTFLGLVDGDAAVQAVAEADVLGADDLDLLSRCLDTGDLLVLQAVPGTSRNGTPSLLVREWAVAAKALHPVPYDGFDDPGARARRRSTDLLVHPRAGRLLQDRSAIVRAVRDTLLADGYTEVETPILSATHGGATARPFRTYSNAYGTDLVLRIAPELALKRLLVGDVGPIFEIGRNFRNEGADATHNPEFTVLEAYRPFADYIDMRLLTERVVRAAARAVHGAEVVPLPGDDGTSSIVDVSGPWAVVPVCEAVSAAVGERVDQRTDLETLLRHASAHGVHVRDEMGPGAVLEELYAELVEPATRLPTFYVDFPVETSPLTGPHRSEPGLVERWDLVVGGMELGTAYSELTDPLEQRRRLSEQSWKAAAGDVEAMEIDEDFLHALELGMPPAGGLGIGLDRLVMLLTDTTIREILAFPFVRPERRPRPGG